MNKSIIALVFVLTGASALAQAPVPRTPSGPPALPPGLHVQVTDGTIRVTNPGGSLTFNGGQFGYVPGANRPPVVVPPNTGLQFVPPPSFNGGGSGGPTASTGSGAVDCVVR